MNYLHRPRRLIVTGRSGTGKTTFFLEYVKSVESDYQNIFIFDPETEFAQRTGQKQVYATEQELQEFKGGIQCYDYGQMYPGELQTGLEFYADYCFEVAKKSEGKKSLFCVDEMQRLISTDNISHELACLIETGRRYCVDTIFVSQQVNLLHNRVRNQVTEVCTFRQNDERAIKWLGEFGFNSDEIRVLNSGDYIDRCDTGKESRGNIFGRGRPVPDGGQRLSERPESGVDTAPDPANIPSEKSVSPDRDLEVSED